MGSFWTRMSLFEFGSYPRSDHKYVLFIRYVWIFRICFRYNGYFVRFLVYDYSFWFQVYFQIKKKIGYFSFHRVRFWIFWEYFSDFLIFRFFWDPKYPNICGPITSISGTTTFWHRFLMLLYKKWLIKYFSE